VGISLVGAALALVLALLLAVPLLVERRSPMEVVRQRPLVAGLLAVVVLCAIVAVWQVARRLRTSRRRDAASTRSDAAGEFNPNMTFTEAAEAAQGAQASEGFTVEMSGAGVPEEEEVTLEYEEAAGRQAWEGEIEVEPPLTWPDRPLVVAIADGVSSGLRSAEISHLATRTVWYRTFYHLHALGRGAPPETATPWLVPPAGWPPPGPARDELLVRAMTRGFADANAAVIMAGNAHRRQNPNETRSTATTLSLVAVDGPNYFLVHAGDCSVHHVHGDTGEVEAKQIEHNRAALFAQGDPVRHEEARRRGLHHILTRWVGMTTDFAALDPQVMDVPGELSPGDALVLCSDGLDKHVDPESIGHATQALDAEPAARWLVGLANDRGGSDHIAVAVLHTRPPGFVASWAARRALWRENFRTAAQLHGADVAGLAVGGTVAAVAASAAVFLSTNSGVGAPASPAATPTALPAATPLATPPVADNTAPPPALPTALTPRVAAPADAAAGEVAPVVVTPDTVPLPDAGAPTFGTPALEGEPGIVLAGATSAPELP
jgi:serine/threonine protein phosphatase PrpC